MTLLNIPWAHGVKPGSAEPDPRAKDRHREALVLAIQRGCTGVRFDPGLDAAFPAPNVYERGYHDWLFGLIAGLGLKAVMVLQSARWHGPAWRELNGGRRWLYNCPPVSVWEAQLETFRLTVRALADAYERASLDPKAHIYLQVGNEMGIGGAGSVGGGWEKQLKDQLIAWGFEGTWPDSAFWHGIGAPAYKPSDYDMPTVGAIEWLECAVDGVRDLGYPLIAPGIENETPETLAREAATAFRGDWFQHVSALAVHAYVPRGVGGETAYQFASRLKNRAIQAAGAALSACGRDLPVWVTEYGISPQQSPQVAKTRVLAGSALKRSGRFAGQALFASHDWGGEYGVLGW